METRKPITVLLQDALERIIVLETKVEMLEKIAPQNLATSMDFQDFKNEVFAKLDIPTEPTIIENV